jgi:hypothetical protein
VFGKRQSSNIINETDQNSYYSCEQLSHEIIITLSLQKRRKVFNYQRNPSEFCYRAADQEVKRKYLQSLLLQQIVASLFVINKILQRIRVTNILKE